MASPFASRQSPQSPIDHASVREAKQIMQCDVGVTRVTLEDGIVLALQATPIKVQKRLDKLDADGTPTYDVDVNISIRKILRDG